jgi:hypothetical protein
MDNKSTIKKGILLSVLAFLPVPILVIVARNYDLSAFSQSTLGGVAEVFLGALLVFPPMAFILLSILYFLREEIFRSWLKLTKWYLPIATVIITWSAMSGSSGGWGMPNFFDSESMSWFTAGLFLLISLILIIKKSIQFRG